MDITAIEEQVRGHPAHLNPAPLPLPPRPLPPLPPLVLLDDNGILLPILVCDERPLQLRRVGTKGEELPHTTMRQTRQTRRRRRRSRRSRRRRRSRRSRRSRRRRRTKRRDDEAKDERKNIVQRSVWIRVECQVTVSVTM